MRLCDIVAAQRTFDAREMVGFRCTRSASAAIPRKLGYRHVKTLVANKITPLGGPRDTLVFELTVEDYQAAQATIEPNRA